VNGVNSNYCCCRSRFMLDGLLDLVYNMLNKGAGR